MKKKEFEYDFKFDWVIRKIEKHSLGDDRDSYKKKLMEKLEEKDKPKDKDDDKL
jgi:hypothetical protein